MRIVRPFLVMAALFAAIMCAGLVLAPDPVRPHNAANEFDAASASERLARILGDGAPHPMDSANLDAVRERLLAEIRALGFAPRIDRAFSCRTPRDGTYAVCGTVENIWFSAGPQSGPAVLAAAHYDSVPAGPGASDDGMGVAAMLEAARVLHGETLQRRVIFLLSDGEEPGLLGAQAFEQANPLYASLVAVVNLDTRGTAGPVTFFETNRPNAGAVRAYAASSKRPLANSIMAAVYEFLPNSTDVTVLRREGLDIVNMAVIDNLEFYHTPRDALANQDRASLQQMGDQGLALLRAFAAGSGQGSHDNLAFTDIASRGFIALPESVSVVLLGLAAAIGIFFFVLRAPKPSWRAIVAPFAALIVAGLLSFGLGWAVSQLHPDYWHSYPAYTRAWVSFSALFAFALVCWWLGKRVSSAALGQSAAAWFGVIGFAGSLALPGLSILFLPVSLLYALGALSSFLWPPAAKIGAILAGVAAVVMWAPLFSLVESALGYDIASVPSLVVALMALPLLGWLIPEDQRRWSAIATGVASAVALIGALFAPAYSAAHPRALNFLYVLDADAHAAHIVTNPSYAQLPSPIAGLAAFRQAKVLPWDQEPRWAASLPPLELPVADAHVNADSIVDGQRHVQLMLQSNGAYATSLRIPMGAHPISATVNGVPITLSADGPDDDFVVLTCWGRSCANAEIEIVLAAPAAAASAAPWYVTGYFLGLPASLQHLAAARPDDMVPIQSGDGAYSLRRIAF